MGNFQIFGLQFVLSTFVYALLMRWYAAPWLARMPLRNALMILLIPHIMRHLGLSFLSTAVVSADVPRTFVSQVAYGDLLAQGLALLSIAALRANWGFARALIWIFNIVGTADLLNAFYKGTTLGITQYQTGAAWYIPTFAVPILFVTHYMIFALLVRRRQGWPE